MKWDWIFFDADETLFTFDSFTACSGCFLITASPLPLKIFRTIRPLTSLCGWIIKTARSLHYSFSTGVSSWAERLNVEPGKLNEAFINAMAEICTPLPGAVSLLNAIRGNAKIGIITNGFSALQQVRLERTGLRDYFDLLVISEEVGVAKPDKKIFDYALEQAGNPDRSRVLMVGDTAESDILGGINAGLATCWLNAHNREQPEGIAPTWTVSSLHELEQLLCKH